MMHSRTKRVIGSILGCSVALALAVVGFGIKAGRQGAEEAKAALPVEQVIASITTAVAAKPGNVRAVEAETEGGKTLCEVEILAQDGQTYEVKVDVATNTVAAVEEEDDDDEAEDEKD